MRRSVFLVGLLGVAIGVGFWLTAPSVRLALPLEGSLASGPTREAPASVGGRTQAEETALDEGTRPSERTALALTAGTARVGAKADADTLVAGRVVDDRGQAIGGADVSVGVIETATGSEPVWPYELSAVTDEDGRFAIAGSRPGARLVVAVHSPEHEDLDQQAVTGDASELVLALERSRHGGIVGSVQLSDVSLRWGLLVRSWSHATGQYCQGTFVRHNEITIPRLAPGTYDVLVCMHTGSGGANLVRIGPVVVEQGRETDLGRIDLTRAVRTVRLKVETPEGEPVRELLLTLLDTTLPSGAPGARLGPRRVKSVDGSFRVNVPNAYDSVELRASAFLTERASVGRSTVEVTLAPGFEVRLRPRTEDATTEPGATSAVALQPRDRSSWFDRPHFVPWDPERGAVARFGEAGWYTVVFRADGDRVNAAEDVELKEWTAELAIHVP